MQNKQTLSKPLVVMLLAGLGGGQKVLGDGRLLLGGKAEGV